MQSFDKLMMVSKVEPFAICNMQSLRLKFIYSVLLFLFGAALSSCNNSHGPASPSTISGTVTYEDKLYGTGGFLTTGSTTTFKPVRFAEIDVVRSYDSMVLATTVTDSAGFYSIELAPEASPVYARVKSTAVPGASSFGVHDYYNNVYAVPGGEFVPSGLVTANIAVPVTNQVAAAFNILDVFVTGAEFVSSLAGTYPPPLTAYWAPAGGAGSDIGTFYCVGPDCPTGDGIYILGNYNGDTDGFDDDVIWHEFGHFIADKYSKDDSPGGMHYLTDNFLDLRLAWSEGWGDFFPLAVKQWLSSTGRTPQLSTDPAMALSHYVDTDGSGYGISFDFAAPDVSELYLYAASEVAVAKVLWDLMAGTTGTVVFGMQPIWDVVSNFATSVPAAEIPWVNLEAFWDRWIALRPDPAEIADLRYIFSGRAIRYYEDASESYDTAATAVPVMINTSATQRTLYKSTGPDRDYFSFTVAAADAGKQFTIKTTGLQGGTDTYLTLYSGGTVTLAENDNASGIVYVPYVPGSGGNYDYYDSYGDYVYPKNTSATLSSKLTFTATTAGTYAVEVKSSPNAPKSAGRYGTYTLTVTQP